MVSCASASSILEPLVQDREENLSLGIVIAFDCDIWSQTVLISYPQRKPLTSCLSLRFLRCSVVIWHLSSCS